MENLTTKQEPKLENITPEERGRLVAYCLRATAGAADTQAAEDLVQQTLLEAWQNSSRLYTPDLRMPWLYGIARNVCHRWLRSQGREASRQVSLGSVNEECDEPWESEPAGGGDPLEEIERADLVDILEQAMSLLPPATRSALVGRYVEDLSQATLAEQLGVSEGAVEARLHRGKQALRKLLKTRFSEQLAAYGLDVPTDAGEGAWQETRVWCPRCGQHRLVARFPEPPGDITFRCPGCDPGPSVPASVYSMSNAYFLQLVGGLSQPRAMLNRAATWTASYFVRAIAAGWAPCTNCGHLSQLFVEDTTTAMGGKEHSQRMVVVCPRCEEAVSTSLQGLVSSLPPVQQFWLEYGRIRALPLYEVEADGGAALVARFQSVTTAGELDLVVARNPFRPLKVDQK